LGDALKSYAGSGGAPMASSASGRGASVSTASQAGPMGVAAGMVAGLSDALERYELELASRRAASEALGVVPADRLGAVDRKRDEGLLGMAPGAVGGAD
jgi:hypothetical protein